MGGSFTITVGGGGRFVIPAEPRQRAAFAPGAIAILPETPGGVLMLTREQLLEGGRRELAGKQLVGELLRERSGESEREDRA